MHPKAVITEAQWDEAFDRFEAGATLHDLERTLHTTSYRISAQFRAIDNARYERCVKATYRRIGKTNGAKAARRPRPGRRDTGPTERDPGQSTDLIFGGDEGEEKPHRCRTKAEFTAKELAMIHARLKERRKWARA